MNGINSQNSIVAKLNLYIAEINLFEITVIYMTMRQRDSSMNFLAMNFLGDKTVNFCLVHKK